jgi:sporulation protein YlmC with PRC-barrel domain
MEAREMADLMRWDEARHLLGESVFDKEDHRIGKVEDLAEAWDKDGPEWLIIRTSLFGRQRLVPIDGIEEAEEKIHVPYSKKSILSAPVPEIPFRVLRWEREELAHHYARAA